MVHQRVVAADAEALAPLAAQWLADEMRLAATLRGTCAVGLAGGSTPRPVYEALAAPPLAGTIPWDRVQVYFGDERAVPPDHPDSNFRMAREALLARVGLKQGSVHRMEAEAADLDSAAGRYAAGLPAALDVLILGVGADGHTASLFPGSPTLEERARRVVAATSPVPPTRRLPLTPPAIAAIAHTAYRSVDCDASRCFLSETRRGAGSDFGTCMTVVAVFDPETVPLTCGVYAFHFAVMRMRSGPQAAKDA